MREQDLADRFAAAKSIAREVGAMALVRFRNRYGLAVERKGVQDQVTAVDHEIEAAIRARLGALFPDDGVLGEEAGGAITPRLWVVDPIDGTACFIAGIPVWCVSIAFVDGGEVKLGVIYDPNTDELFAAWRGHGASLDGAPLRPSPATKTLPVTVCAWPLITPSPAHVPFSAAGSWRGTAAPGRCGFL